MEQNRTVNIFSHEALVDSAGNVVSVDDALPRASLPVSSHEVLEGAAAQRVLERAQTGVPEGQRGRGSDVTDVEKEQKPEGSLSFEDKVQRLEYAVRRQPALRELYLKALAFCRTRQMLNDIENYIAAEPEFANATIDQYLMICTMEKYEGFKRYELTEDGTVVTDEMKVGLDEDGVDDLVACWAFETTPVGCAVVKRNDPEKRIRDLLAAVPGRRQTYIDVLDYCSEHARAYKDIEDLLQGRDVLWLGRENLQQPLQPSVFVDKLERAGAIVWKDGWRVTAQGKAYLREVMAAS